MALNPEPGSVKDERRREWRRMSLAGAWEERQWAVVHEGTVSAL